MAYRREIARAAGVCAERVRRRRRVRSEAVQALRLLDLTGTRRLFTLRSTSSPCV
ncbi:hypothetical protein AB0940_18855 [Streptomyces sp. NPDC006656]|uniref:hypothetical protein n=1 Tax=Streptomyces sp. NPDC006656 TaxID=3156899 RepID=UPI0034519C2C